MSRNHLIPTVITNSKGVQTTVYRRPDGGSGKVSAALKSPPKQSDSMEKLKAEAAAVVFAESIDDTYSNAGRLRKQTEKVLDSASAEQLRNIKEAGAIVLEREMNALDLDWEMRRFKTLVRTGAHDTIAIAVQRYDEAPEDMSLCVFATKETAYGLMKIMRPAAGLSDDKKLHKELGRTSPDNIEHLRRAVHKAHALDGAYGGMHMDAIESCVMGSDTNTAYIYGMYADAIPDSIPPNRASRMIKNLFDVGAVNINSDNQRLTAHLEASELFERIEGGAGSTYMGSHNLMDAVSKYPDRVQDLMAYRRDRQTEDFDTDHFKEYMNGGVMKEGML